MEKINFESLPSTKTPLNPKNMNKMQDNIEQEFKTVKDWGQLLGEGFTDFDEMLSNGFYRYSGYNGKYANNPIPQMDYGIVVVYNHSNAYNVQLIFSLGDGKIYRRICTENRVYSEFRKIELSGFSSVTTLNFDTDCYSGTLQYVTKNGVCYLHTNVKVKGISGSWFNCLENGKLPIPLINPDFPACTQFGDSVRCTVGENGNFGIHGGGSTEYDYTATISYPCQE